MQCKKGTLKLINTVYHTMNQNGMEKYQQLMSEFQH